MHVALALWCFKWVANYEPKKPSTDQVQESDECKSRKYYMKPSSISILFCVTLDCQVLCVCYQLLLMLHRLAKEI